MRVPPASLLQEMIESARLSEAEVDRRAALAADADYWRALAADGHVLAPAIAPLDGGVDERALADAVAALARDAIFQVRRAVAPLGLARLNAIVDAVTAARWPPAFAFVYDELWSCARLPAVVRLVSSALGNGAAQIPHVWTHVVSPVHGTAGWQPHVDGSGDGRLSVWVALTAADVDSGCMYAVAHGAHPAGLRDRIEQHGTMTVAEAMTLLKGVRALPAEAGDALGWTFDVVHWGGPARTGSAGRRSLSLEFIAAGQTPDADERPLVPLDGALPPFDARLRAIAAGLLEYRKFEPALIRFEPLARRLAAGAAAR